MLDTNTCIAIIKRRPDTIKNRLTVLAVEEVGISGIVAAELWYGVAHSQKKRQNAGALKG
jgi:tRNA(fMet)-specific endonuclease VapC